MQTLGQEAQLREVGEGQVSVVVQERGQVGQVEGEGEQRAAAAPLLVQPLFAGGQEERLFFQQRGFTVRLCLSAPAACRGFGGTDGRGALAAVFPAPSADFGGRDGRGREGELGS